MQCPRKLSEDPLNLNLDHFAGRWVCVAMHPLQVPFSTLLPQWLGNWTPIRAYRVRLFILLMPIFQSQNVSQLFEWIAAHIQRKVNLAGPGVACDFDLRLTLHPENELSQSIHISINYKDPP